MGAVCSSATLGHLHKTLCRIQKKINWLRTETLESAQCRAWFKIPLERYTRLFYSSLPILFASNECDTVIKWPTKRHSYDTTWALRIDGWVTRVMHVHVKKNTLNLSNTNCTHFRITILTHKGISRRENHKKIQTVATEIRYLLCRPIWGRDLWYWANFFKVTGARFVLWLHQVSGIFWFLLNL
jgi:hypothetical protein